MCVCVLEREWEYKTICVYLVVIYFPLFFFLGGKGSNLYCDRLLCVLVALRYYVLKYVLAHLSCTGQSKVSFPAVKN